MLLDLKVQNTLFTVWPLELKVEYELKLEYTPSLAFGKKWRSGDQATKDTFLEFNVESRYYKII